MIGFIILLTILFSVVVNGQQTAEESETEKEKLAVNKENLQNEIANLKIQIDSLITFIPELEQKLNSALRELYILKYDEETGNKIAYKQIWIGMTNEMVKDSWGEPDRIDQDVEAWGTFTQWYYGDVTFFFKDGKLTEWEGEEEDQQIKLSSKINTSNYKHYQIHPVAQFRMYT